MKRNPNLTDLVRQTREISFDYLNLSRFVDAQPNLYSYTILSEEMFFTGENFDYLTIQIPVKRMMQLPNGEIKIKSAICRDNYPGAGNTDWHFRVRLPILYDPEDVVAKLNRFVAEYTLFTKSGRYYQRDI